MSVIPVRLDPEPCTEPTKDRTQTDEYKRLMRYRAALLEQLRAFEDLHDLPRSIPTKFERGEVVKPENRGHHNRG